MTVGKEPAIDLDTERATRVLVIGTFDAASPRARQWLRLLDRLGCDVEVRNVGSWGDDRAARTAVSPVRMLVHALAGVVRAATYLVRCSRPDVVVFLYPGHLDACVLGPIARLRRIPAVLDVFISLYDTVVLDRRLRRPRSPAAFALRALDTLACWSVPLVVADTPEHADFLARLAHRDRDRFAPLPVGADPRYASRAHQRDAGDDAPVLWYLNYIPLHGADTVVRAAALLTAEGRAFRLVGDGQDRAATEALARELGATNIEFVPAVPEERLLDEIAGASMCLGVFGTSDKAGRVVANKVFQCAAAGRAVITADTPAVARAFGDALVTVPVGDPAALADAIRRLRGSARLDAATRGQRAFAERFSDERLAPALRAILDRAVRRS